LKSILPCSCFAMSGSPGSASAANINSDIPLNRILSNMVGPREFGGDTGFYPWCASRHKRSAGEPDDDRRADCGLQRRAGAAVHNGDFEPAVTGYQQRQLARLRLAVGSHPGESLAGDLAHDQLPWPFRHEVDGDVGDEIAEVVHECDDPAHGVAVTDCGWR